MAICICQGSVRHAFNAIKCPLILRSGFYNTQKCLYSTTSLPMDRAGDYNDVEGLFAPRQAGLQTKSYILEQANTLPDMDAIMQSNIRKELGGKLIGRNTFVRDEQEKASGCLGQTFLCKWYHALVYDTRPNTTSRETRSQQWASIHNPMRYFPMLFFYLGPPGYLIYNLRYPLSFVTFLTFVNAVYYTISIYYPHLPI